MAVIPLAPRLVVDLPIACPAGSYVGETVRGSACRCRIEHSTLAVNGHGNSLAAWCLGDYQACPSWRSDREADWAARKSQAAELLSDAREVGEA